jgi:hypothetical protein
MTAPNDQGSNPQDRKRHLALAVVIICILLVVGIILFQIIDQGSMLATPVFPTPRINLPSVQYPTIPPSAPSYIATINSVGSSGVAGSVTFKDVAGAVAILLHVDGLPEEDLVPVELRRGTCEAPGTLAYALVSPDAGESETDLSINLKQFNTQKPLAVIIYRSAQDRTTIACGDVP